VEYPGVGRVLVVVPTYNEAENLPVIAGRLRRAVPAAQLLVVDDDRPDGTGRIADRLAGADLVLGYGGAKRDGPVFGLLPGILLSGRRRGVAGAPAGAAGGRGASKMSSGIVGEAMWRVAVWGYASGATRCCVRYARRPGGRERGGSGWEG
jgi:hypothetical protein